MVRLRTALLAVLLTAAGLGCGASAIPRPTDSHVSRVQAEWPGTTRQSLERGRDLYVARCSGCHSLFAPAAYPAARWRELLGKMGPRARLSREERELVLHYLIAVSGRDAHI
jgi:cytochrome c5